MSISAAANLAWISGPITFYEFGCEQDKDVLICKTQKVNAKLYAKYLAQMKH